MGEQERHRWASKSGVPGQDGRAGAQTSTDRPPAEGTVAHCQWLICPGKHGAALVGQLGSYLSIDKWGLIRL